MHGPWEVSMFKPLVRTFSMTVIALLFLTTPSALGRHGLRHDIKAARHGRSQRHRRHHSHKSKHHASSFVLGANTTGSTIMLLGDQTVESNKDSLISGQAEAFPFQARSTGIIGGADVYIDSRSASRTVFVGLYGSSNGRPSSLLVSSSISAPQAGAWNAVSLPALQLEAGATYWLAVLGTGGMLRYRDRAGGSCRAETSLQTNLSSLSSQWRVGQFWATCPISAFVIAAPSSGLTGPVAPVELPPPGSPPADPPPPAESPPVESPPPPAPVNTALPLISGLATEGQSLAASNGSWSGEPVSVSYQWQDCESLSEACSNVAGATGSSYTLESTDVGHTIRVVLTATNAGGSASASSAATAMVAAAPPSAPVNTALPVISGTATEGQALSTSNGSWSNSPTSFSYQWQDCNSSGGSCVSIAGATSSTYKLAGSDVAHTVRVLVTAINAGGSASASSAATTVVAATPPTASFTYTPASPVVGETITFNGSSSTCAYGPCTYQWSDDGGLTRPIPPLWPLGSGQTLQFTFSSTGTKYVRLVVMDAAGQEATVEHNVVVASAPPVAPSNTGLPAVSGSPQEGQTLTASNGTWAGTAPISLAYQWQDCNSGGGSCANIAGKTGSSYKLGSGDVGHTIRVAVTASNTGGSTAASSTATTVVVAAPPLAPVNTALPVISGTAIEGQKLSASSGSWSNSPTGFAYQWEDCNSSGGACSNIGGATSLTYELGHGDVGHTLRVTVTASNVSGEATATSGATVTVAEKGGTPTNCFPKLIVGEACGGYPNGSDTGVPAGTVLTKHVGQLIITKEGETVSKMLIEGGVVIRANNVHLEDDEVVSYTQAACGERSGGAAVTVIGEPGTEKLVSGVVIKHDTIRGVKAACPEVVQTGVEVKIGSAATTTVEYNKLYWVARCFQFSATWENNYCLLNATLYGEHYDDVFENGWNTTGAGGMVLKHNTLFNFHEQTSNVAMYMEAPEIGEERVENNFLAGGGFSVYVDPPKAGDTLVGPVRVVGNRVARCLGEAEVLAGEAQGVHICKGYGIEDHQSPGGIVAYEEHGFFPLGGSFGVFYPAHEPATISGNYWDNNLEEIPEP
jgi:hypothetical protein